MPLDSEGSADDGGRVLLDLVNRLDDEKLLTCLSMDFRVWEPLWATSLRGLALRFRRFLTLEQVPRVLPSSLVVTTIDVSRGRGGGRRASYQVITIHEKGTALYLLPSHVFSFLAMSLH